MKTPRRTRITISIVSAVLLLLAVALFLRMKSPPEVARLLPECDGIIYLNLQPLRAATHFDQHPVQHDPDYQQFIDATGINPEHDLDQVALALQRMPDPNGPNGPVAFSEVFEGHFNRRRLADYLKGVAGSKQVYAGRKVYIIPHDGRTVRVVLLGYDMVAVSNTPTAEQIHSIIDRYRTAALPFTGSSLLAAHYADVPLLSPAWGIGKIGLPLNDSQGGIRILGISLPLSPDSTFIASLRWIGKTQMRVVEIAPSAQAAATSAEAVGNLLQLVRNVENAAPVDAADPQMQADIRSLMNSAQITHKRNRAVLTATIPAGLLEQLLRKPANIEAAPQSASPSSEGKGTGSSSRN